MPERAFPASATMAMAEPILVLKLARSTARFPYYVSARLIEIDPKYVSLEFAP
jgi:hypothetical protein